MKRVLGRDPEIGRRTEEAIREKCWRTGSTYVDEMHRLGGHTQQLTRYKRGEQSPSADFLAEMCRQGYDVVYILTGYKERSGNGKAR